MLLLHVRLTKFNVLRQFSLLNQSIDISNEARYNKLNKKLGHLRTIQNKHHTNQHDTTDNSPFYTRVKNLSKIKFNKEEHSILETGHNYAFESQPKRFLRDLIIDTENVIQHLDSSLHNVYRFMASKKKKSHRSCPLIQ
jgi:pantothenate kinase